MVSGHVYGILCPLTSKIGYVGITTLELGKRLVLHKRAYKVKLKHDRTLSKKEQWFKSCEDADKYGDLSIISLAQSECNELGDLFINLYSRERKIILDIGLENLYNGDNGGAGRRYAIKCVGIRTYCYDTTDSLMIVADSLMGLAIKLQKPNSASDIRSHRDRGTLYLNRYFISTKEINLRSVPQPAITQKSIMPIRIPLVRSKTNKISNNAGGQTTKLRKSKVVYSATVSDLMVIKHDSIKDAGRTHKIYATTIINSIKNRSLVDGRLVFFYEQPNDLSELIAEYKLKQEIARQNLNEKLTNLIGKPIEILDINTGITTIYRSISSAVRSIKVKPSTVRKQPIGGLLRGRYKIVG